MFLPIFLNDKVQFKTNSKWTPGPFTPVAFPMGVSRFYPEKEHAIVLELHLSEIGVTDVRSSFINFSFLMIFHIYYKVFGQTYLDMI